MTCPDTDKWNLFSASLLSDSDTAELTQHLQGCESCRAALRRARRDHATLLRAFEVFDRGHDRLREDLLAALPAEPPSATGWPVLRLWSRAGDLAMRLNSQMTRRAALLLAPAACILIALAMFMTSHRGSAFAAAIAQLHSAQTIVCHVNTTLTVEGQAANAQDGTPVTLPPALAASSVTRSGKLYLSATQGIRRDWYKDNQEGQPTRIEYIPAQGQAVQVCPADRTFQYQAQRPPEAAKLAGRYPITNFESLLNSPDRLLSELGNWAAGADRELGRQTIDGRDADGFEIAGDKVGFGPPLVDRTQENRAEVWVDVATGFPVRVVFRCTTAVPPLPAMPVPLGLSWTLTTQYDHFEWDAALAQGWFQPNVPGDYTQRPTEEWPPVPDEAALVNSLRVFSDMGGRYPASLSTMTLSADMSLLQSLQAARRIVAKQAGQPQPETPAVDPSWPTGLFLYPYLWARGCEPQYAGNTVKPGQADAVLMQWKLNDGSTRVLYGDLRLDTVASR